MRSVVVTETIHAAPELVFDMASDIKNFANNISGIIKSELLTEGDVGVGTRWRETRVMFGQEASEEMEFVKFDRPHGYEVKAASHGSAYTTIFEFESVGDSTKLSVTFSAEPLTMFSKVMSMVMWPLMRSSIIKALGQDLADIKDKLEN